MAIRVYADRVGQQSNTKGTSTFTLGATLNNSQAFSVIGDGSECTYVAIDNTGNTWEVGHGVYSSNTLTRDTIEDSSSGGGKINFANNPEVYLAFSADVVLTNDRKNTIRVDKNFPLLEIRDGNAVGYRATAYMSAATSHAMFSGQAARGTEASPADLNSGDEVLTIRAEPRVSGAFDSTSTGTQFRAFFNGTGVWWTVLGATHPASPVSGSINATAFYDDGSLICYPIEAAVDGEIDLAKWDSMEPSGNKHEMARKFDERKDMMLSPEQYSAYWHEHKHLPSMPGPDEWLESGKKIPVGGLVRSLWEAVECQAVHIKKLLDRIEALENKE